MADDPKPVPKPDSTPPSPTPPPDAPPSPDQRPVETGGPKGPEPTRYGDWEKKGIAVDF